MKKKELRSHFSSPEPKAPVHYCNHALSVVRQSSVRLSSVRHYLFTFSSVRHYLFTFSSSPLRCNLSWTCLVSGLLNFNHPSVLLFCPTTDERNSTKRARKLDLEVLYQVSVFRAGQKKKTRRPPGIWLDETFSTSALKPLNGIERNLTGCKISTSSTKFVFFGVDLKNKMAASACDWLRHFRLLVWNRWPEFNESWQDARSQRPLPILCCLGWSEKRDGHLASDLLGYFVLLVWNCWTKFNENWQEATSQRPSSLCFSGRSEKQDDSLGHSVKKRHIVLRYTLYCPLGPLLRRRLNIDLHPRFIRLIRVHRFIYCQNYMILFLCPSLSVEAVYCIICGSGMVA